LPPTRGRLEGWVVDGVVDRVDGRAGRDDLVDAVPHGLVQDDVDRRQLALEVLHASCPAGLDGLGAQVVGAEHARSAGVGDGRGWRRTSRHPHPDRQNRVLVPELTPQPRPQGAHPAIVLPARPAGNTHRSAALAGLSADVG
jgi:hypothetical protein